MYIIIRVGLFTIEMCLFFYSHDVQEFINQTLRINSDFGTRYLARKEVTNKGREYFLLFLLTACIVVPAIFHMFGLFLTFSDLLFAAYPMPDALRGKYWLLICMTVVVVRIGFALEESGTILPIIIGNVCMTSTAFWFWLKKTW
jgi:hypothetical protein